MRIEGWSGEIGGPRWWARVLSFGAGSGALLGLFGPFGSYMNGSFLILVLHWTLMTALGTLLCGLSVPRLVALGIRLGLPALFALTLSIVIMAAPLAAISAVEARWLWPQQTAPLGPADWYAQTLAVCLCLTAAWLVLEKTRAALRHAPAPAPAKAAPSAGPALCLQMEDHYVRVHTSYGSTLELMPLQEAIDRYGGNGLQVHRSWWVAAGAVRSAEREARNWRLTLVNGLTVPIARNRVVEARARGWIGAD